MDDLISRQAAIEAMRKAKDKSELHRMLAQLPSALPGCEDAVNRKAVIDAIDKWKEACTDNGHKETVSDIKLIRKDFIGLPSVTPKQPGWIPCSERNPEKNGFYLVTTKAVGWNCTEYIDVDTSYYGDGIWYKKRVLAWCELPTPWEGGQDETD